MLQLYHPAQAVITQPPLFVFSKVCSICHEDKPLEDFYEHPTCRFGVLTQCKPCYIARQLDKEYSRQKPVGCIDCGEEDLAKFYHLPNGKRAYARCRKCQNRRIKRFGVTHDKREKMTQDQNGVCAICGKSETSKHQNGGTKRLAIDHNHKTGKVRGLLCGSCNRLLGDAKDDPKILKNAIAYLRKHRK